ncbi:MAG: hypothetical protein ACTSWL_09025 [Promethearchaeota archaeon]
MNLQEIEKKRELAQNLLDKINKSLAQKEEEFGFYNKKSQQIQENLEKLNKQIEDEQKRFEEFTIKEKALKEKISDLKEKKSITQTGLTLLEDKLQTEQDILPKDKKQGMKIDKELEFEKQITQDLENIKEKREKESQDINEIKNIKGNEIISKVQSDWGFDPDLEIDFDSFSPNQSNIQEPIEKKKENKEEIEIEKEVNENEIEKLVRENKIKKSEKKSKVKKKKKAEIEIKKGNRKETKKKSKSKKEIENKTVVLKQNKKKISRTEQISQKNDSSVLQIQKIQSISEPGLVSENENKHETRQCSICHKHITLEFKTDGTLQQKSDEYVSCPLEHVVHIDCLKRWIIHSKRCPICYEKYSNDVVELFLEHIEKVKKQKIQESEQVKKKEEELKRQQNAGPADDPEFDRKYKEAQMEIKNGNHSKAILELWNILDEGYYTPNDHRNLKVRFTIAISYNKLAKYGLAIRQFMTLVKIDYNYPLAFYFLGLCYEKIEIYDKAHWAFVRAQRNLESLCQTNIQYKKYLEEVQIKLKKGEKG